MPSLERDARGRFKAAANPTAEQKARRIRRKVQKQRSRDRGSILRIKRLLDRLTPNRWAIFELPPISNFAQGAISFSSVWELRAVPPPQTTHFDMSEVFFELTFGPERIRKHFGERRTLVTVGVYDQIADEYIEATLGFSDDFDIAVAQSIATFEDWSENYGVTADDGIYEDSPSLVILLRFWIE